MFLIRSASWEHHLEGMVSYCSARLDGTGRATYIWGRMNRILLALLAILAGLVTQVSPAQARLCVVSETEIGATEASRGGTRSSPCQSALIVAPATRQERSERGSSRARPARLQVYIPSVLFGADRAFE